MKINKTFCFRLNKILVTGQAVFKVSVELFVHFGILSPRFFLKKFVFLCFEDVIKSSFVDW